jgi:hypothetical protein
MRGGGSSGQRMAAGSSGKDVPRGFPAPVGVAPGGSRFVDPLRRAARHPQSHLGHRTEATARPTGAEYLESWNRYH